MHCDCCDKLLDEAEASARFVESNNFVNMCTECRGYLPRDLKWRTRQDLARKERGVDDSEEFDMKETHDDTEEDS